MLKYEQVKEKLYFTHNYGKVNVLYKGILVDEDGLPEITDKEAMAIATYIAFMQAFKEGLKTNNGDKALKTQITAYEGLYQAKERPGQEPLPVSITIFRKSRRLHRRRYP